MSTYRSPSVFKCGYPQARTKMRDPEYRRLRDKVIAMGVPLLDVDKLSPLINPKTEKPEC
ncbi:MAG: hypothetical protein AAGI88_02520 [Pseudomonadota bacterium]